MKKKVKKVKKVKHYKAMAKELEKIESFMTEIQRHLDELYQISYRLYDEDADGSYGNR